MFAPGRGWLAIIAVSHQIFTTIPEVLPGRLQIEGGEFIKLSHQEFWGFYLSGGMEAGPAPVQMISLYGDIPHELCPSEFQSAVLFPPCLRIPSALVR